MIGVRPAAGIAPARHSAQASAALILSPPLSRAAGASTWAGPRQQGKPAAQFAQGQPRTEPVQRLQQRLGIAQRRGPLGPGWPSARRPAAPAEGASSPAGMGSVLLPQPLGPCRASLMGPDRDSDRAERRRARAGRRLQMQHAAVSRHGGFEMAAAGRQRRSPRTAASSAWAAVCAQLAPACAVQRWLFMPSRMGAWRRVARRALRAASLLGVVALAQRAQAASRSARAWASAASAEAACCSWCLR